MPQRLEIAGAQASRGQLDGRIRRLEGGGDNHDHERRGQHGVGDIEGQRRPDKLEAPQEEIEADGEHDGRHDHGRYEEELESPPAAKPAARQADGRRRAEQRRQHHGDEGDAEGQERRLYPLAGAEVVLVPAERPGLRRELDEFARVERDHHDDENGRAEKDQRQGAVRPEERASGRRASLDHARLSPVSRSSPSSELKRTKSVPTTVRRKTPRLAPKFQSRRSRTTSSITVGKVTSPSPPRRAGVM